MQLEQMLEFAPRIRQTKMYETIDVYTAGTTALYTPPLKPFRPRIIPSLIGIVIPHPITDLPLINLHDTYKIDRYDNLYGGHTTADSKEGKKKIYHKD